MNARAACGRLLEELGTRLGLEKLELDAEDKISLQVNGHPVILAYSEELEELFSLFRIAPLPRGERRGEALRGLLRGSYAWGGTAGGVLGLDTESGWVCLNCRDLPARENPGSFLEKTARRAGLADFWQEILEGRRPAP